MLGEAVIPLFDFAGMIGFFLALGMSIQNYRRRDVERPFWLAMSLTAALGCAWLLLATLEWRGISSALLDQFSTTLQAVVIGLYAVGVIGTYAIAQELKRSRIQTSQRSSILSILSRVLQHDLRNDLTLVRGYTRMIDGDERYVNEAIETIDNLIGTSEKTRKLEQLVTTEPKHVEVSVDRLLDWVVTEVQSAYPNADITVDAAPNRPIEVLTSLETTLTELVENAAQHGGDGVRIQITADVDEGSVTIRVHDDGPGIPEHELEVLGAEGETSLLYSDCVGMWIARWIVEAHNGRLRADIADGGSELAIEVPANPIDGLPEEGALRPGYDRYYDIFEHDVECVLILDDALRVLDANDRAGALFGMPAEGMLGRTLPEFVPTGSALVSGWEEAGAGEVFEGSTTLPATDDETRRVIFAGKLDIVLGEHLLVVQDAATFESM